MPYPSVYNNILKVSSKYYSNQPSLPLTIASQFLWFNYFIKIHNKVHKKFLKKKKQQNLLRIYLKKMENSKPGSRSLVNLKFIKFCISNEFN